MIQVTCMFMKLLMLCTLSVMVGSAAFAQNAPPVVRRVTPIVVQPGEKTTIEVTGSELAGATTILFEDPRIEPAALRKAEGDTIRAEVRIPVSVTGPIQQFRVVTPKGISNTALLGIGRALPAVKETESNDGFKSAQSVPSPVAIHGAINSGNDVDLYAIDAKRGETLVAEVLAARVGSDLDAMVTIFSPDGRELAADDDLFGRDATVWATIPDDGRYVVQIQDANGQVNNAQNPNPNCDYVINLGQFPVVTSVFPPGGRRGGSTVLRLDGANLPENKDYRWTLPADAPLGDAAIRLESQLGATNPIELRIGDAPEFDEPLTEPADDPLHAIAVNVPVAINGRFQRLDDGDVDLFRLKTLPGLEGDYSITALAAKVGSTADPLLTVIDAKGTLLAEDDDALGRDAFIERRIDSELGIVIGVREAFGRGGDRFVYRLEVTPLPKVVVTADLSARTISRDGTRAIPLTFARHGYDGPLTIDAASLPEGVSVAPMVAAAKSRGANLIVRCGGTANLGAFPLSLKIAEIPEPGSIVFHESRPGGGKPVETGSPLLCVAEPAALGVSSHSDIALPRGGQADWKLTFERRGDAAKKPIKLRLIAAEGDLDGIEVAKQVTINADTNEAIFTFKTKADTAPRRVTVAVRAWFDGVPEANGIDSATTIVIAE
jgi:hypothetical protein